MPTSKKKEPENIQVPGIKLQDCVITVKGSSPLICNKWSEKAKQEIRDKQMKIAKAAGREAKDPEKCFKDSLYKMPDGNGYGFPAIAFKAAAVNACSHIEGLTKVSARGSFHIPCDLIPIKGKPIMREDMVRVGMGAADLRYRGEFTDWEASIPVKYNSNAWSIEQLINVFNVAGFASGVGEWRPQKNGNFGMFSVTEVQKMEYSEEVKIA